MRAGIANRHQAFCAVMSDADSPEFCDSGQGSGRVGSAQQGGACPGAGGKEAGAQHGAGAAASTAEHRWREPHPHRNGEAPFPAQGDISCT